MGRRAGRWPALRTPNPRKIAAPGVPYGFVSQVRPLGESTWLPSGLAGRQHPYRPVSPEKEGGLHSEHDGVEGQDYPGEVKRARDAVLLNEGHLL